MKKAYVYLVLASMVMWDSETYVYLGSGGPPVSMLVVPVNMISGVRYQVNQGSPAKYKFPFNMVPCFQHGKFDVKLIISTSFLNDQINHQTSQACQWIRSNTKLIKLKHFVVKSKNTRKRRRDVVGEGWGCMTVCVKEEWKVLFQYLHFIIVAW